MEINTYSSIALLVMSIIVGAVGLWYVTRKHNGDSKS